MKEKTQKKHHAYISILIMVGLFNLLPLYVVAEDTESITSYISVTASTGGNSAVPGENIQMGESKAEISIETTVNGDTTEQIQEEVVSAGDVTLTVDTNVSGDNSEAVLEIGTSITQIVEDTTPKEQESSEGALKLFILSLITYVASFFS